MGRFAFFITKFENSSLLKTATVLREQSLSARTALTDEFPSGYERMPYRAVRRNWQTCEHEQNGGGDEGRRHDRRKNGSHTVHNLSCSRFLFFELLQINIFYRLNTVDLSGRLVVPDPRNPRKPEGKTRLIMRTLLNV